MISAPLLRTAIHPLEKLSLKKLALTCRFTEQMVYCQKMLRFPSRRHRSAVTQEKRGELVQSTLPQDNLTEKIPQLMWPLTKNNQPQSHTSDSLQHGFSSFQALYDSSVWLSHKNYSVLHSPHPLLEQVNKCSRDFSSLFLRWEYCSCKLESTIFFSTYCHFSKMICLHLYLYDIEKYQIIYFLKLFYSFLLEISSNCTTSKIPRDWSQ